MSSSPCLYLFVCPFLPFYSSGGWPVHPIETAAQQTAQRVASDGVTFSAARFVKRRPPNGAGCERGGRGIKASGLSKAGIVAVGIRESVIQRKGMNPKTTSKGEIPLYHKSGAKALDPTLFQRSQCCLSHFLGVGFP